jgi:Carboxypeptidase regulatory-like domain
MHRNRCGRLACALALLVALGEMLAVGQSTAGRITGSVLDPGGAVIPGVQITLINSETGSQQHMVSAANGTFSFPNVPAGIYSTRAEYAGFTPLERTGIQLFADETVTVDMKLAVLRTQSEVQVEATPALIDTQESTISAVIPGAMLEQMPVLTRQFGDDGIYGNVYFSPGVTFPASNNVGGGTYDGSNNPPINGARQLDTVDTIDGMTVMSNTTGEGGGPVQPSIEAIQEIHTVLAGAPAEFWRSAAITVVTKSGTNQFHGSLFYDYNGNSLNARSYFSTVVPFRVYNNFGGSISGPILKDKLFFFADYEGSREAAQLALVANVPTLNQRAGDFSDLAFPITNPYTGQPFSGNQIPAALISSSSQELQTSLYPVPNYGPASLQAGNFRGLVRAQNGYTVFDNEDASINYIASQKDTLFLRASYRHLPVVNFTGNLPAVGRFNEDRNTSSGVISELHMFAPNLSNEARIGFTDMDLSYAATIDGLSIIQAAGLQGTTVTTPIKGVPPFNVTGISSISNLPSSLDHGKDLEWNDNLTWTKGRNIFKFGVDQIIDRFQGFSVPGSVYGSYSFNGLFSGYGYSDFLLGLPQQTQLTNPPPTNELHGILLGAYAQDTFKLNSRLTFTAGIRWEYQGPYSDVNQKLYSFDPKTGAEVVSTQASLSQISPYFPSDVVPLETAAQAGYPTNSFMFSHYLNFYPRVGFAWSIFPDGSAALRGGFGLYGNNIYGASATNQTGNGGPFVGSSTFINSLTNGQPLFSFPKPFLSTGSLATQTAGAPDPHLQVPYTEQWNLSLEQKVLPTVALQISYVGTHSAKLVYPYNFNQPPPSTTPFSIGELAYPNYQAVNWSKNGGVENYNSLQISATKTYGKNLFFNTGFTWAKDLTDVQDYGNFEGTAPLNIYCLQCEYGNSSLTRTTSYYANLTYLLPFGKGQHFLPNANRVLDGAVRGWNMAWIATVARGTFFSPYVSSGFDTANTDTSFVQRPDLIGNPNLPNKNVNNWFNINAYAIPGCPTSDPLCNNSTPADVGRFGSTRPGTLVGPALVDFNLSLMKDFHVREGQILKVGVTTVNTFNHPSFDIPDPYVTDGPGVAGVITSLSAAAQYNENWGSREIDIIARFQF